ncbi:cobalt transport protein, partial [Haematococcus lacustris]
MGPRPSTHLPLSTTLQLHLPSYAQLRQLWLVSLYFMIARALPEVRLAIAGAVLVATTLVYPRRLWASQLWRLGLLCAFIFMGTALGADGLPPLLQ